MRLEASFETLALLAPQDEALGTSPCAACVSKHGLPPSFETVDASRACPGCARIVTKSGKPDLVRAVLKDEEWGTCDDAP
jgi:hypothetical protein